MITHLAYAVPAGKMGWETAFWQALGYGRITRPEPKMKGQWLTSWQGGSESQPAVTTYIHLMPFKHHPPVAEDWSHVAIVARYGWEATLNNLERLSFRIPAEDAATHWGARRIFLYTPTGYRVELVEFPPPARWSGPPEDD